jgi:hypothetical protein
MSAKITANKKGQWGNERKKETKRRKGRHTTGGGAPCFTLVETRFSGVASRRLERIWRIVERVLAGVVDVVLVRREVSRRSTRRQRALAETKTLLHIGDGDNAAGVDIRVDRDGGNAGNAGENE